VHFGDDGTYGGKNRQTKGDGAYWGNAEYGRERTDTVFVDRDYEMKSILITFLLVLFGSLSLNAQEKSDLYTACEHGDKESCRKIGNDFLQKDLSVDDTIKQLFYLSNACDKDDPEMCVYIAAIYYQGEKIRRNPELAAYYYGKACNQGIAGGCHYQAELVDAGIGEERDRKLATLIYKRGCESGEDSHCKIVGSRYEQGLSVKKSLINALLYYQRACSLAQLETSYPTENATNGCDDFERLKQKIEKYLDENSTQQGKN